MILERTAVEQIATDVAQQVLAFSKEEGPRVSWISSADSSFRIYVRNARRTIPPMRALFRVLDLATVEVETPLQRQGIFTKFLDILERETDRPLYLENVLNDGLVRFLTQRKGWVVRRNPSDFVPSFLFLR